DHDLETEQSISSAPLIETLRRRNDENSPLLNVPPEILSLILYWVADAVDILAFTHSCSTFFHLAMSPFEWYSLYKKRFPLWSSNDERNDKQTDNDDDDLVDGALGFKRVITVDGQLRRRLGAPFSLEPSSLSAPLTVTLPCTSPNLVVRGVTSAADGSKNEAWAEYEPATSADEHVVVDSESSLPQPMEYSCENEDHDDDDSFESICYPEPKEKAKNQLVIEQEKQEDDDKPFTNEKDQRNLRVLLDNSIYSPSDPLTATEGWFRVSSPVYNIDLESKTTLAASLVARHSSSPLEPFEFQIMLYVLPDLSRPIAVIKSDIWKVDRDSTLDQQWFYPYQPHDLPVVQLVELKHAPFVTKTSPTTGATEMRIVIGLAFGENVGEEDMLLLDIWKMLKVVELWVPITSFSLQTILTPVDFLQQPRRGRVETIDVGNRDQMRARMVKIYTADVPRLASSSSLSPSSYSSSLAPPMDFNRLRIRPDQDAKMSLASIMLPTMSSPNMALFAGLSPSAANVVYDSDNKISNSTDAVSTTAGTKGLVIDKIECIAIFGIQNSENSAAIIARKVLFAPSKAASDASWVYRPVSRGVSCITLFPYQSGYERLLVMFNRYGRGMIWDWVQEVQVAQLRMPEDKGVTDGKFRRPGHVSVGPQGVVNAAASIPADSVADQNEHVQSVSNVNEHVEPNDALPQQHPQVESPGSSANVSPGQLPVHAVPTIVSAPINVPVPASTSVPVNVSVPFDALAFASVPPTTVGGGFGGHGTVDDASAGPEGNGPNLNICYWGVQVSFAETPRDSYSINPRKRRSFRIVALADGVENEWESCWWHIDSASLGPVDQDLADQELFVPSRSPAQGRCGSATTRTEQGSRGGTSTNGNKKAKLTPEAAVFLAVAKRSERETLGIEWLSREQRLQRGLPLKGPLFMEGEPMRFNAYVVWNRYRICLTSTRGLVMVDLEEIGSQGNVKCKSTTAATTTGTVVTNLSVSESPLRSGATDPAVELDKEWVTYLENNAENPLVDIATVNNSLVITRKFGHLVWPFYAKKSDERLKNNIKKSTRLSGSRKARSFGR
ncbi:hypothetical protein BGZ83_011815, partial [Gryganskiella cystojenkinii]